MFELIAVVPSNQELSAKNVMIIDGLADGIWNVNELIHKSVKTAKLTQLCTYSNKPFDRYSIETEEAYVIYCGRVYWDGVAINSEICERIVCELLPNPQMAGSRLSGNFLMVIMIKGTGEIYVFTDRMSSGSIYYASNREYSILSTNMMAMRKLQRLGFPLSINKGSILEFIGSGHMYGNHTFWNEVSYLCAGCVGKFEYNKMNITNYWKYTFEQSYATPANVDDLWDAVQRDFEKLPDDSYIISQSGGYDSRMLAYMLKKKLNRNCIAVSYSLGDNISGSDQITARKVADACGMEIHTFTSTLDPDVYMDSMPYFIEANDGQTDVIVNQMSFLGKKYIDYLNSFRRDYIAYGHEIWGWGERVYDSEMAFWSCFLLKFNEFPQPKTIINPQAYTTAQAYFDGMRKKMITEYPMSIRYKPDDLKDFLYWRHRESRVILSGLKSLDMDTITPFLGNNTSDALERVPSSLRRKKKLFMEMGRKYAPEIFLAIPPIETFYKGRSRFGRLCENKEFRDIIKKDMLTQSPSCLSNMFSENFEMWLTDSLDGMNDGNSKITQKQRIKYNLLKKANGILGTMPALQVWAKHRLQMQGRLVFPCIDDSIISRLLILNHILRKLMED